MPDWFDVHSAQAIAEGWGVFWSDSRGWMIQRDDEQAIFATDDDATNFVLARAAEGSECHQQALDWCADTIPET